MQFVVILLHGLFHLARPDLGFPRLLVWVELGLMAQMLFMFGEGVGEQETGSSWGSWRRCSSCSVRG
jgi:hypothetical protein